MKKLLCLGMIVFMLVLSMCGCVSDSGINNDNANNQINNEPKIVNLTAENIDQYLIFSTDLGETEKFDNPYAEKYLYTVKMTIKTSPKQNVEFENLTVYFDIVPDDSTKGYGWDQIFVPKTENKFEGILNVPFNGDWEEVFEIKSEYKEYVSSNPSLKIKIVNVSGTAKHK